MENAPTTKGLSGTWNDDDSSVTMRQKQVDVRGGSWTKNNEGGGKEEGIQSTLASDMPSGSKMSLSGRISICCVDRAFAAPPFPDLPTGGC